MRIVKLPFRVRRPTLACGADMKGAFALAKNDIAYIVNGFGPLRDPDNLHAYKASIVRYEKKLKIKPSVIACDCHPDYLSTQFAEQHGLELIVDDLCDIQHHEAHIASSITDNRIRTDVIGIAFDGTGYGLDGRIWGGEFFVGSLKGLKRVAHLEYISMPGNDAAIEEPWRMAVSYLHKVFGKDCAKAYTHIDNVVKFNKRRSHIIRQMIDRNVNAPFTSSVGRLFDAVASLVLSRRGSYAEAELPIELERIAAERCDKHYGFDIKRENGMFVIAVSKSIKEIIADLRHKTDKGIMSAKFHNTLAEIILDISLRLRLKYRLRNVVLAGGVFQNRYLKDRAIRLLKAADFNVYMQPDYNVNDNGIPLGQLAIANVRGSCV